MQADFELDPPPLIVAALAGAALEAFAADVEEACATADLIVTLGGVDLDALSAVIPDGKQALSVLGPHDPQSVPEPFRLLHANGVSFRGWRIAGFSGARQMGRASGLFVAEEEAASLLERLPACDLFLSHTPPAGLPSAAETNDRGFQALRSYIEEKPPIYHFYAHQGEDSVADELSDMVLVIGVSGLLLPPELVFA